MVHELVTTNTIISTKPKNRISVNPNGKHLLFVWIIITG